jgi:hypothetical protein
MERIKDLNENELVELWQQLQSLTHKEVSYQHLLRSLEYWDDSAIGKVEAAAVST